MPGRILVVAGPNIRLPGAMELSAGRGSAQGERVGPVGSVEAEQDLRQRSNQPRGCIDSADGHARGNSKADEKQAQRRPSRM